jgi:hydrogenase small subunit
MEISRRDFLRYSVAGAAALGLSGLHLTRLQDALAGATSPAVVWLSGSGCTGCSVSLLNAVSPTIDQVLLNTISLKYHPNVMAAAGDLAVQSARSTQQTGGYILAIEGSIPTASGGRYCYVWDEGGQSVTMASAVQSLAAGASKIVAVGSCASFGGVSAACPGPFARGAGSFLGRSVVNLPGCPANPDWVVGALAQLASGGNPTLDSNGRPTAYFGGEVIHDRCPREEDDGGDRLAFGIDGACLRGEGCKGPHSHCDCDSRKWNNKQSYCIGVNGLCIGCTEPDYPAFPLHTSSTVGGGATPTPVTTPRPVVTPDPQSPNFTRTYLPHVIQNGK